MIFYVITFLFVQKQFIIILILIFGNINRLADFPFRIFCNKILGNDQI